MGVTQLVFKWKPRLGGFNWCNFYAISFYDMLVTELGMLPMQSCFVWSTWTFSVANLQVVSSGWFSANMLTKHKLEITVGTFEVISGSMYSSQSSNSLISVECTVLLNNAERKQGASFCLLWKFLVNAC